MRRQNGGTDVICRRIPKTFIYSTLSLLLVIFYRFTKSLHNIVFIHFIFASLSFSILALRVFFTPSSYILHSLPLSPLPFHFTLAQSLSLPLSTHTLNMSEPLQNLPTHNKTDLFSHTDFTPHIVVLPCVSHSHSVYILPTPRFHDILIVFFIHLQAQSLHSRRHRCHYPFYVQLSFHTKSYTCNTEHHILIFTSYCSLLFSMDQLSGNLKEPTASMTSPFLSISTQGATPSLSIITTLLFFHVHSLLPNLAHPFELSY